MPDIELAEQQAVRVFISYSSKDVARVAEVVRELDDAGIFTIFAAVDLRPGMDLIDWLNLHLGHSSHLVLFWSKNAAESPWVRQEWQSSFWEQVQTEQKVVIPVRLDHTELPPVLRSKVYVDATGESQSSIFAQLMAAVIPEIDFRETRRSRMRELTEFDRAVNETESEKVAMIRTARDSVFIGIYDFFLAPSSESLFISLLRSTGVHALAGGGLERKETVSGRRRITGHLQGTRESFTQMESMLRDHGVEAVRNSLFAG
jgi:hypothetical protein